MDFFVLFHFCFGGGVGSHLGTSIYSVVSWETLLNLSTCTGDQTILEVCLVLVKLVLILILPSRGMGDAMGTAWTQLGKDISL